MRRFKPTLSLSLSLIIALVLFSSACSSAPPSPAQHVSSPTAVHNPTVTLPPKRTMRVDIGGYQLYVQCIGQGTPTVVFEAGLGGDISSWHTVQPEVGRFTQACAYDRANVAPSDVRPAMLKVSAQQFTKELHALLVNGHIPGPYILVGHSLGGLFSQMYACQYPHEVAGMVLVDSTHPEQTAHFKDALGPAWIPYAMQGFPAEGITFANLLTIQAQVDAVKSQFPNVPLIVLARSRFSPALQWTAQQIKDVWMSLQSDLAKRSSKGKLVIAQNSGHDIPNERPDLVISSIHEIFQQAQ